MPGLIRLLGLFALLMTIPSLAVAQIGGKADAAKPPGGGLGGAMPAAAGLMQVLDVDGDGTLSAKEIRAATKALKTLDANGDGKLTPDELTHKRPAAPARGRAADAAAKGRLGIAPGAAAGGAVPLGGRGVLGGGLGGFGNPRGVGNPGGLGGVRAGSGRGLPMTSRQMRGFDKNRDGKVTRDEMPAEFWKIYARFDINRDGRLDPLELQRADKAVNR